MSKGQEEYRRRRRQLLVSKLDPATLGRLRVLGVVGTSANDRRVLEQTCLHLWARWVRLREAGKARRVPGVDYRFIRKVLGANGLPHCRAMLRQVWVSLPAGRCSKAFVEPFVGACLASDIAYVRSLANDPRRSDMPSLARATLDELLLIYPPSLSAVIRVELGRRFHPPIVPPNEVHNGRALSALPEWQPLIAGMVLRHAAERRATHSTVSALAAVEAVMRHAGSDGDVERALRTLSAEEYAGSASEDLRRRWVSFFVSQMELARAWLEKLAMGAGVTLQLPDLDSLIEIAGGFNENHCRSNAKAKEDRVSERLAVDDEVSALVDFRVKIVATLAEGFRAAVERARNNGVIEQPFNVTLRSGRSKWTLPFRAVRTDRAWDIVLGRAQWSDAARVFYRKHRREAERLVDAGMPQFICLWDRPFDQKGETEPFFVDLYRFSLIDIARPMTDEARALSTARARALKFKQPSNRVLNLLSIPRELTTLSNALRGEDILRSPILIPVPQLEAGLLQAALLFRMTEEAAPRGSEALQVRCAADGIGSNKIAGRDVFYFRATAKGKDVEELKYLSDDTARIFQNVVHCLANLVGDGERTALGNPMVPAVSYRGFHHVHHGRRHRYVFQNGLRGLTVTDLNLMLRVLLIGIADIKIHGERSISATRLGLATRDKQLVRRLLSHGRSGVALTRYDFSDPICARALASLSLAPAGSRVIGRRR